MNTTDPVVGKGAAAGLAGLPMPARRILADEVHESITALIMDHAIPPDTKVSIEELARRLEVSPTPVRESLARLEAAGLVRKEALRGYFTTRLLNRTELDELFEFRRLLEPRAARTAAAKVTAEGAGQLRAELRTAGSIPTGADYDSYKSLAAHDTRFHLLVFELAGNRVMRNAFEGTRCHLHLFRLFYGSALATPAVQEHRRIVAAITAHDPDAAEAAMLAHIDASYERLKPAAT
ncbi:MAG: GntR family transcriptional regulator [Micromonosporaceae bacterium]